MRQNRSELYGTSWTLWTAGGPASEMGGGGADESVFLCLGGGFLTSTQAYILM